ncbi:MAG: hypothetical protein ACC641_03575 [Acidiferrobacterales bacterium]
MRKYLLANLEGRTRRGMTIEINRTFGKRQYSSDIVSRNIWECADTPLLAIMINPLHAECVRPRLFEIRGEFGQGQNTIHRVGEVILPDVSPEQKLAFAMYCVRSIVPEHAFGAWVERWLANIDRSIVGAQQVRQQLAMSAEQGDKALAMLSDFGTRRSDLNRLHDSEFEFLRRARDVVDAAAALIEKPRQWRVMLSELVATATNNILGDSRRSEFAELAVQVVPANNKRQLSEPKRLLRRRDDDRPRKPTTRAYAIYKGSELKIVGRKPNLVKR